MWRRIYKSLFLAGLSWTALGLRTFASEECELKLRDLVVEQSDGSWNLNPQHFQISRPRLQEAVLQNLSMVIVKKLGDLQNADLQIVFEAAWVSIFHDFRFVGPWWKTFIFENPTGLGRELLSYLEKLRDFQVLSSADQLKIRQTVRQKIFYFIPDELISKSDRMRDAWRYEAVRSALEAWDHSDLILNAENCQDILGVSWSRLVRPSENANGTEIFDDINQVYGQIWMMRERELESNPKLKSYDLRKISLSNPSALLKQALEKLAHSK